MMPILSPCRNLYSGHQVSTFKKGPDYIDPMWLGLAR